MDRNHEQQSRLIYRLADIADRYQQVSTTYYSELRDYGTGELYTSTEVHMVTRIEENPGITASRIAEATNRTKSAISQMVAKLEAKELIYRKKNPENGKQYLLYVTARGRHLSLCHKAYDEKNLPLQQMQALFGMEAVETFGDIMDFLIQFYLDSAKK